MFLKKQNIKSCLADKYVKYVNIRKLFIQKMSIQIFTYILIRTIPIIGILEFLGFRDRGSLRMNN